MSTIILPDKVECRGKNFEVQLPHSFHTVTGVYVSDATFNTKSGIWTALANVNGMLCLVEVSVKLKEN